MFVLVLTLLFSVSYTSAQQLAHYRYGYSRPTAPKSPCPHVFNYQWNSKTSSWYGILTVPVPAKGQPLSVNVYFYTAKKLQKNNVGSIRLQGTTSDVTKQIRAKEIKQISLEQKFPSELSFDAVPFFAPPIHRIYANNKNICKGYQIPTMVAEHVTYTHPPFDFIDNSDYTLSSPSSKTKTKAHGKATGGITPQYSGTDSPIVLKENGNTIKCPTNNRLNRPSGIHVCGKPSKINPLIVNGMPAERGDWPWLVAVHHIVEVNCTGKATFVCGASLISMRHVVSAAHCFKFEDGTERTRDEVYLELGKYDLSKPAEAFNERREVNKIIINKDFEHVTYKNDIAVLVMDRKVDYSAYTQPICLWMTDKTWKLDLVKERNGTVVGWGLDENSVPVSNVPRMASVPIVSQEICQQNAVGVRFNINENSLCGGLRDGSGPCTGDSGGGLFFNFPDDDGNSKWYLRGIVSLSSTHRIRTCNLLEYVIYTDISNYADWINDIIGEDRYM